MERENMAGQALSFYQTKIDVRNAKVLEVGCGTGHFSIELARAGASVVAVDIGSETIRRVKDRAKEKGINLSAIVEDAQQASFADNTFDLILCRNVIEHVEQPGQLMNEMARILKPGGSIQLTAPNRYSISQLFRDEHYRLPLVAILPRKLAALVVCRIINLEDEYSVSVIPSYALLKTWIKTHGLISKMDLPDGDLIREKWVGPEKVNNRLVRCVVRISKWLGCNHLIGRISSSERFLGLLAPRWSLWLTKPAR